MSYVCIDVHIYVCTVYTCMYMYVSKYAYNYVYTYNR